ncbi:MAG TPA: hypothetical protein VH255_06015 [Verrucomicrobiae bacterium]|nr:hypothetical protein [Verrucomicrobiae bacterium]
MGSGSSQGRYRLDTRYRLPTFGTGKNPFAKAEENAPVKQPELQIPQASLIPAPVVMKKEEIAVPRSVKVQLTEAEVQAANLKKTQEVPKPTPVQAPTVVTNLPQEKLHPMLAFLDWLEFAAIWCKTRVMSFKFKMPQVPKLNPAAWIPKRKSQGIPVVARAESGPVQAELSLEKVRVIRNDLSDADLEIVAMKATPPKPERRENVKPAKGKNETPAELVEA